MGSLCGREFTCDRVYDIIVKTIRSGLSYNPGHLESVPRGRHQSSQVVTLPGRSLDGRRSDWVLAMKDWTEHALVEECPAGRTFSTQYYLWHPPEWPDGTDNGEYTI